jgi:Holliday junction resolvase RusA-like endonuclease
MNEITFTVDGEPIALKRHRTSRGRTYDPSSSDKDDFLLLSKIHKPKTPLQIPLRVVLLFGFSRPKSHFGTGRNADKIKDKSPFWKTSVPDNDNLAKFVCDALNGVFWKDDSYIVSLHVQKFYTRVPRVEVTIDEAVS